MSHLNDASGWRESDEATHHPSFLGYYLEEMSRDAHEAGPPLLDVLDVHWYAESETIENGGPRAIIHAPRSLYDEAYQEPTWIGTWFAHELPVLHRLKSLAAEYAPGTRIAITEYDFRLGGQIYGGLAQVDALGAFGREGVYLAGYHAHAEDAPTEYIRAAFELFLDCEGVAFGDLSLPVAGPDSEDCVVYAARASASGRVHVIALNRSLEEPLDLRIRCERPRSLEPIRAWSLDRSGPIVRRGALPVPRTGGAVHATMPALSAWHFVFETRDPADDVRE
jgi:mannan endo-1,4-beta-mannosidase